jgi:hypothetical protein
MHTLDTYRDPKVTIMVNGGKLSIAQTAMYVPFKTKDVTLYNTTIVRVIYEALEDSYGGFEKVSGAVDDHCLVMTFSDHSSILVSTRRSLVA